LQIFGAAHLLCKHKIVLKEHGILCMGSDTYTFGCMVPKLQKKQ
jgi:hypothetical protein